MELDHFHRKLKFALNILVVLLEMCKICVNVLEIMEIISFCIR